MAVILNEFEVVREPEPARARESGEGANARPAKTIEPEELWQRLRELDDRERRLRAD